MKAIALVLSSALVLLAGCNDAPPPPGEAKPEKSATTPTDYLKNITQAERRATKTIDLASLNKAIESFFVQEGHFPKDLLELVEKGFLPKIPELPPGTTWDYDTNAGIVSILKG